MSSYKVTVKLYPLEYLSLYEHLLRISKSTERFGLNTTSGHLLLHDLFQRKKFTLRNNATNHKGKMRGISFKPHEARALYDELRIYSSTNVIIGQIFGHLDRSMVNLGFQNQQV